MTAQDFLCKAPPNLGGELHLPLFRPQVWEILFALDANELENVSVQHQMKFLRGTGPGFGVRLGIVDRGLQFQVSEIRTPKPLSDAKSLGRRMALLCVEPRLVVKP